VVDIAGMPLEEQDSEGLSRLVIEKAHGSCRVTLVATFRRVGIIIVCV
jgi:hypothetical protein